MGQNVYALTYQKFCLSSFLIKNMEKSNLSLKGLVLSTITITLCFNFDCFDWFLYEGNTGT